MRAIESSPVEEKVMEELIQLPPRSFAFGPYVLIPERQLLLEGAAPVRIGGRAMAILTALVEQAGALVGKRELMARVWPDGVVDESNLKVNVAALRRALGDGGSRDAKYIATIAGRGYQFIASVTKGYRSAPSSPPATRIGRRHNLPIGTTRVLGRAEAIDTIRNDLETSHLVTIVGPGGIGKTTVALAVAEQLLGDFEDGVWLVDLALGKDPSLAPNAIATAIGLPVASANMLTAVCDSLRGRELLLVLDSCEHLIEVAVSCVNQILASAPGVKIMVTSREPLLAHAERVRELPGLRTPPSSLEVTAEAALAFSAVQLFVERATDRLESFKLEDADAPGVAEICRRLDGLALAIELAATRIDAFGVGGLLKQLDDRFRVLVGLRAAPARHRTLTATLDWSYGLLSEESSAVLRALSVFAGVFDIEGASAVSSVAPSATAAVVAELAAKSLLAVDLEVDMVAYRLLETTRAYCRDKLDESGDADAVRQRHAEHVCMMLERAMVSRSGPPAREWEATYRGVLDDLRAALAWADRHPVNRQLLFRLTLGGCRLWNHFSLNDECRVNVTKAIQELHAAGLTGTQTEMQLQESLAGAIICTQGLLPRATEAARRALNLAIRVDDIGYHLRCLRIIGVNELLGGDLLSGMRTLETFTALAAVEDPSVVPAGAVHLASGEFFLGRLDGARRRLEDLKRRYAREVDSSYFARFLWDVEVVGGMVLSNVLWVAGLPDTSVYTALAAVEHAQKTGHELSVSNALAFTCPLFLWNGQFEQCHRYVTMWDEKAKRYGIIAWRPVIRFYQGALACEMGLAKSTELDDIRNALEELRAMNHMVKFPYYKGVLADELAKYGRIDEAEETILDALGAAESQSEGWCMPELLRIHASTLTAKGLTDQAEALLLNSLAAAREMGALSWQLRTANDLAKLWRDAARADDARRLVQSIHAEFTEGSGARDLAVAAEFLAATNP
jgi:predicted ATPase/DNA-binding winged helix-turn-helix (wHTH) protein